MQFGPNPPEIIAAVSPDGRGAMTRWPGSPQTSNRVIRPAALSARQWEAVAAILDNALAWSPVESLPGGLDEVVRLAGAGWVEVWPLADGPHATLTPWAACELGVVIAERYATTWHADESDGIPARSRTYEECPAWATAGDPPPKVYQPRAWGFAPLPFPERLVSPPPIEPGPSGTIAGHTIATLKLLGSLVTALTALRPRAKSGKAKARRRPSRKGTEHG